EDDHQRPGSPAASTRFVLRRTGNEIWLQDRATRPMRVTIQEHVIVNPPLGYAVEARYPAADVRYAYRFDPEGDSTRVSLDVDIRPRHVAGFSSRSRLHGGGATRSGTSTSISGRWSGISVKTGIRARRWRTRRARHR